MPRKIIQVSSPGHAAQILYNDMAFHLLLKDEIFFHGFENLIMGRQGLLEKYGVPIDVELPIDFKRRRFKNENYKKEILEQYSDPAEAERVLEAVDHFERDYDGLGIFHSIKPLITGFVGETPENQKNNFYLCTNVDYKNDTIIIPSENSHFKETVWYETIDKIITFN